ncbi:MAG: hypothetical protein OXB91_07400 [Bryobacterales bacterium]|nr:hypothetical protein [Bryobacterales bacterium]
MPDRLSATVEYTGAADPNKFEKIHPFIGLDIFEDGVKAAGRVVTKKMRQTKVFKDRSRTLRKSFRVAGSRYGRFVPSARIRAAPHLQLIELGHRAFGPPAGSRERAGRFSFGGRDKYVDSGKRTKKRPFSRKALRVSRGAQIRALNRVVERGVARIEQELQKGEYGRKTLRALNRDRRYKKVRERDARRHGLLLY